MNKVAKGMYGIVWVMCKESESGFPSWCAALPEISSAPLFLQGGRQGRLLSPLPPVPADLRREKYSEQPEGCRGAHAISSSLCIVGVVVVIVIIVMMPS